MEDRSLMRATTSRATLISVRHRCALAAAVLLVLATLGMIIGKRYMAVPDAGPAPSQNAQGGTFRLTDAQLRSVVAEPVVTMQFHSEEVTDGKIAFNGDTLTPVYSPYSGRV